MSKGWEQLHSAMQALTQEIREIAPDNATADEGEAYIARVLTASLNECFLAHLLTEDGFSRALPTRGAPNPDYIMQHALLDSTQCYQLTGCLNGSERVGVGLFRYGQGGSVEIAGYLSINSSNTDQNGHFQIEISAGATGKHSLDLQPDTCILLVRTLHRDQHSNPARLRLIGATAPTDLTLTGGSTNAALNRAIQTSCGSIRQFFSWSEQAAAYPNQFRGDIEGLAQTIQGDPDTDYFLGYFQLEDHEALQITMPSNLDCYWSIHAYNHWCEYIPGASAHDRNTVADSSGEIVIHIGAKLPEGIKNPVNTKSRQRGVLVCRVIGGSLPSPPKTQLIGQVFA